MNQATKKITAKLPMDLLENAQRITRKGITHTLIEGLHELSKREKRSALRNLKGKIRFVLDLEKTRA